MNYCERNDIVKKIRAIIFLAVLLSSIAGCANSDNYLTNHLKPRTEFDLETQTTESEIEKDGMKVRFIDIKDGRIIEEARFIIVE